MIFSTPVSQIDKLERQNPNIAINVFGWEKEQVIVHRLSEKGGDIPRTRITAMSKDSQPFCSTKATIATANISAKDAFTDTQREICLKGTNPKSPTRTETPKEEQKNMTFTNYHKQMKVSYVVYADFECVLRKIDTCEPDNKRSFTVKTEKHEPCGFSYLVVRSDGQTYGPFTYTEEKTQFTYFLDIFRIMKYKCVKI